MRNNKIHKRVRIYPYKLGSKGAKALKDKLIEKGINALIVKADGRYIPRRNDLIIGWGCSNPATWGSRGINFMNWPEYIGSASNKLTAFNIMKDAGVVIPEFTTNDETVWEWLHEGNRVLARRLLQGHSGEGITMLHPEVLGWSDCPLYVKYIKKAAEYRVHVFKGTIIDIQQKKKRQEVPNEEVDYEVRNHENGWVFCRENIVVDDKVKAESLKAVEALGLDFGAVDVIWNNHQQEAYILEVNTSPGLEGETVGKYADSIINYLQR